MTACKPHIATTSALMIEVTPPRQPKRVRMYVAVDAFGTIAATSTRHRKTHVGEWIGDNVKHRYGWRIFVVDVRPIKVCR